MTDGPQPMFPLPSHHPADDTASSYPRIGGQGGTPAASGPDRHSGGPSLSERLNVLTPKILGGVVGVALVILAAVVTVTLVNRGSEDTASTPSNGAGSVTVPAGEATPCASPPALQPDSTLLEPDGLVVTTLVTAQCRSGDLLSNNRLRVTIVDEQRRDVASGIFDLSATPVSVGADGASVTLTFPAGTYWRTPEATVGGLQLTAYKEGTDRDAAGDAATFGAFRAVDVGTPQSGSIDAAAHSALVDIAAADRTYIDSHLLEAWQPQLSSKYPGLFADGLTWTFPDIVREHLELRQRFPGARVVWSPDWPVYKPAPEWWITLSGVPFGDGHAANQWCTDHGFDPDHCYAKKLSHTLGTSETTMFR